MTNFTSKPEACLFLLILLQLGAAARGVPEPVQSSPSPGSANNQGTLKCAVCEKSPDDLKRIWYTQVDTPEALWESNGTHKTIKNCSTASLKPGVPCQHNGSIVFPTKEAEKLNFEGIENLCHSVEPTDCSKLNLPQDPPLDPPPDQHQRNASTTAPTTAPPPPGTIIGSVIGVLLFLLICTGGFIFLRRRFKSPSDQTKQPSRAAEGGQNGEVHIEMEPLNREPGMNGNPPDV